MHQVRRKHLMEKINNQSILIIFSGHALKKTADQFFPFVVNRNFFYLTGLEEANMALVMIRSNNQIKEILFKEIRSPERALWDGELLTKEEATTISKIEEVRNIETLEAFIKQITSSDRSAIYGKLTDLHLDLEANDIDSLAYKFSSKIRVLHPYLNINNIHQEIASLRMIKSDDEINNIKSAIKITNEALNNVLKNIKSGIYEYEVVADYNYILGKHNVEPSFDTIAASGHNATVLHYVKNDSIIPKNSLMLFDLGVNYNNYASDISRTYPVDGKFTPRQKEFYELVLKANKETIKMLKPGVTWKEFNDFAKDILANGLIKMGLIKEKEEISKYYYHSIGHFLGLDVHDVGVYNVSLQAGMVVTVEPGLYISEEDIGIRIEDDILITENGSINLSIDIPKEVDEIEKLMK